MEPCPPPEDAPLVALLGGLVAGFEAEFNRRIHDTDMCALSLAHSRNVLRHLARGPLRAARIVELSGVSKQAVSQQVAHLVRNGYVTVEPDPTDQRARTVALTARGEEAQRLVKRLFREIERDWAGVVGEQAMADVRIHLARLMVSTGRESMCR